MIKIFRAVTVLLFAVTVCVITVVLCGTDDGGCIGGADDSVPALSDSVGISDYTSYAVRTEGILADGDYPRVFIAKSAEDVAKYRRVYENVYDFSYGAMNECAGYISFDDITARYGDGYFQDGALIITACVSPSDTAPVFGGIGADGYVILTVGDDDDTAQWHMITEISCDEAAQVYGVKSGGIRYDGYAAFSRIW